MVDQTNHTTLKRHKGSPTLFAAIAGMVTLAIRVGGPLSYHPSASPVQ